MYSTCSLPVLCTVLLVWWLSRFDELAALVAYKHRCVVGRRKESHRFADVRAREITERHSLSSRIQNNCTFEEISLLQCYVRRCLVRLGYKHPYMNIFISSRIVRGVRKTGAPSVGEIAFVCPNLLFSFTLYVGSLNSCLPFVGWLDLLFRGRLNSSKVQIVL